MSEQKKIDQWAIVELFGHTRIAGRVGEQAIGGCAFVRVDVPAIGGQQAVTKLYGQGAIYAITFTDEATARMVAEELQVRPISEWSLREAMRALPLPGGVREPEDGSPESIACRDCGQPIEDCTCDDGQEDERAPI